ncbi:MAG: metallophosphoesterase [Gaiellaceae bacterium]
MPRPFLLVQLSDPHIGATWGGGDPVALLAAAVDAVLALPVPPDAVLVSGDVADTGAAGEYGTARELLARLGVPVHVLPGNHDDRAAMRVAFEVSGDGAAPLQDAVDLGPLRLLLLDSIRPGADDGELDDERLAWLEDALAAGDGQPTVVALHHPPLLMGGPAWDDLALQPASRQALARILERHRQVLAVVGGHTHRAATAELAGRVVVSAPSTYGQARLDLGAAELDAIPEPPGFAVHALVDGRIVSHFQPVAARS